MSAVLCVSIDTVNSTKLLPLVRQLSKSGSHGNLRAHFEVLSQGAQTTVSFLGAGSQQGRGEEPPWRLIRKSNRKNATKKSCLSSWRGFSVSRQAGLVRPCPQEMKAACRSLGIGNRSDQLSARESWQLID